MRGFVDGYEQLPIAGRPGLRIRQEAPFRFTVHTTEGRSWVGAVDAYNAGTGPPHFTVDYAKRKKLQHIPIDRGAYALKNGPLPIETNAIANVQIEFVGFAKDMRSTSNKQLVWMGEVFAEIADEARTLRMITDGFTLRSPRFWDEQDGVLATVNAPQRVSQSVWSSGQFSVYGHQHVPDGNHHWDPGFLPLDVISTTFNARFVSTGPVDEFEALQRKVDRQAVINARQAKHIHGLQTRVTALEAEHPAV